MANNNDIKVIVDTNLWISWLITKDYKKLDKLLVNKKTKLVFSIELFEEFIEVANRPKLKKYFSKTDLEILIELIDELAYFIDVKSNIELCRDAKDNFLLSLAVDAKADFLLTGDKDLLELKKIKGTKIITIADFIEFN
jgi:uncharacterized protein